MDSGEEEEEMKNEYLEDLQDGAGCTEIWEHLSRTRKENRSEK